MSINKVILVGNVGRDPEVRYFDGSAQGGQGSKLATFTLATSERVRDQRTGETRENTEWHNIVAWRQNADVAERFVRKGTQLYIEGKLRTRSWTDQQGVKKFTTEIMVDTLQLLGKREDGGAPQAYAPQQPAYAAPAQPAYAAPAQPAYQAPAAPAQPAYQAPAAPSPAPAQEPIDLGVDTDDLPF